MKTNKKNQGMPIVRDERTKAIGRSGYKLDDTKYNMPIAPDLLDLTRAKELEEAFRRQII